MYLRQGWLVDHANKVKVTETSELMSPFPGLIPGSGFHFKYKIRKH